MKYLKSHKLFESLYPREGRVPEGYEFVKDVFQDISDEGYLVNIEIFNDRNIRVYITKPMYKSDGETISKYEYFHPDSIVDTLKFSIDYLSDTYHMKLIATGFNNHTPTNTDLKLPTFKNKSGKHIPELLREIKLVFSPPLRKIESYQLFEASGHWREDILPKLNWNRIDELYEMMLEFQDLGWTLPKKEAQISRSYTFGGIQVAIKDGSFNEPSKKLDLLETEYYKTYKLWMVNPQRKANYDKEFFKEIVDLLSKLEGFEFNYRVQEVSRDNVTIELYNKEDVFDPSIVIKDMKKAKVKVSIGIDNALDRLHNQQKIMNIEKVDNTKAFITQKIDKYDLDRIYDILNKTLNRSGDKFNVVRDYSNDRIIIATRGKWV